MTNIGLCGASGKMGQEIIKSIEASQMARLSAIVDKGELKPRGDEYIAFKLDDEFMNKSDVVIDFSSPSGTLSLLEIATNVPKPLVIGTTGLSDETLELIKSLSEDMPILYATNMSLGVAVLNRLAQIAAKALAGFDAEIVEMHHRHKKDAPSGTALTLASSVAKARELNLKDVMVCGRQGMVGARSADEIAVLSQRGGDIVGRHTVGFYNDGEFIELNHTATSRATFANGALRAALWLVNKEPGLYNIDDCLGL